MDKLANQQCTPCEGGMPALSFDKSKEQLQQTPQWTLHPKATDIRRKFTFANFHRTMDFVNRIADLAHQENHHPDLEVSYGHCIVKYSTHAIKGLSINDFICAAKIDELFSQTQ